MIDLLCLLEFYNTYEHDNVFYDTAEKMLMNFEKLGHMSMQELADSLFISTSTLYRFVKMMAYDSHNQMRSAQAMFLEQYMYGGRYLPKGIQIHKSLKEYGEYITQRIHYITEQVSSNQLDCMVQAILNARNIIFLGIPMPSAVWRLQIELILLGKETSAFLNPQHQIDAIKKVDKDCLIFMIQYMPENSSFYLDLMKELKEKQIPTAAISNIPVSPTLKYIDYPATFEGDLSEGDMLLIEILLNSIGNDLNHKVIEAKSIR